MHLTVMHGPLRSAVLGSKIPCSLSPFIRSSSASTTAAFSPASSSPFPALHQKCQYSTARSLRDQLSYQQKRHASTRSTGQSLFRLRNSVCSTPARSTSSLLPPTSTATLNISRKASTQSSASSSDPSSSSENLPLDWNSFFLLRASRRKYSIVSSFLASLATTFGGLRVILANNLDAVFGQTLGLDPFMSLIFLAPACAAVGWLLGPVLGNSVWGVVHRKYKASAAIKEKEFYNRIKRFRVDPSVNSYSNPVPDYYGEKIGSIQGYRQWLKDQRAYNRKRRSFL
ncbi:hypothetical protein AJ79_05378 [Helicocarpus griseus UAMH5409]|uniref:Presequence translocated-associated motor subunit PAM17 n=1 Tax=Helicocarpus griseus UAMH5409 TaxID=1447875 RepID=A0A2B7XG23_9EURO|nr:hypothetical protein AJ79_05378 [Helicocarpus griseus UAMH5409]